jgi:hypothetical protein
MRTSIEKRRNELCFGLLKLHSQEKDLQAQLARVQESIEANITAIAEMEKLLTEGEGQ